MRKKVSKEIVVLAGIARWLALAAATGGLVGLSTTAFLKALGWTTATTRAFLPHHYLLLPVCLAASVVIVRRLAPEAAGHGTEKVIEAVHRRAGRIPLAVVPVKLVATLVTMAGGGSVGKEGPCAQIGAGLSSAFADLLRFGDGDRRRLVICGISAGFAAVFGTPVAGAVFALEVLVVGRLLYEMLLPSLVAALTAYHVSSGLGIAYFHAPIAPPPAGAGVLLAQTMLAGVFFGAVSLLLVEALLCAERLRARLPIRPVLAALLGGALLVLLSRAVSTDYFGLGFESVERALRGEPSAPYAFLAKTVFTAVTLGSGGSGGIVTPIFFIGATAGNAFARFLGLDACVFAAFGFVAVLAGAANTPVAAAIMAMELFGGGIGPYAAVACVLSFILTGRRSVYPSQVLGLNKIAAACGGGGRNLRADGGAEP